MWHCLTLGLRHLAQGRTTPRPFPGALRRRPQLIRWLWTFSTSVQSTQGNSSSTHTFLSPGYQNRMADEASRIFELSSISLLAHMSTAYPRLQSSWQISLLAPDLLSCMISTLHRNPCKRELHKMLIRRSSTRSGATSTPPSRSILLSRIHPFLASRSSKSTGTASDMPSTPCAEWTNLESIRFLRHGG